MIRVQRIVGGINVAEQAVRVLLGQRKLKELRD